MNAASDARKLDQRTQEALRQRAVLLVENGATHMERRWLSGFIAGRSAVGVGIPAQRYVRYRERKARSARGDQLILTEVEARRVQRWIRDKMPDQCNCPSRCGRRKRTGADP